MKPTSSLIIKKTDFLKISSLLTIAGGELRDLLQDELDRATIVSDKEFPNEAVSMNSLVTFLDLESKKTNKVTLVYPGDSKIEEHRISILAPVGAALIGLRVGQKIKWPLPNGKEKEIQVVEVAQAESTLT